MSMRTPLGRVRGLGSARSGTGHFWQQRLTAIAAVPLTIAGVVLVISLTGRSYPAVKQILASPLVAVLMLLFILSNLVHMKIGMQVIIEDYVHDEKQKLTLLVLNTFFSYAIGLACVFAVLKISFGV
jgi:succinate dehydrogenase / fumarate reductase, membrane anchor subunit